MASPLFLLLVLARPVMAEDVSSKTENYLFAASEALHDGEPALALSLLKRARDEDPNACIVQEYLCRAYVALADAPHARDAFSAFSACMVPADEPIRQELSGLVKGIEVSAPPPVTAPPPVVAPNPVVVSAPVVETEPETHVSPLGWILAGSGAAIGIVGGVASVLYDAKGQTLVDRGDRDGYEALLPYNHAAVIVGGAGGAVAVTGVVLGVLSLTQGHAHVAVAPGRTLLVTGSF